MNTGAFALMLYNLLLLVACAVLKQDNIPFLCYDLFLMLLTILGMVWLYLS